MKLKMHYRLFLIDAYVLFYRINHILKEVPNLTDREKSDYCVASFNWIQQVGFLPFRGAKNSLVVWLLDSKPYWRTWYCPEYKEGRPPKPPLFNSIRDLFFRGGYPSLALPSYEADDLAALYVAIWGGSRNGNLGQVYLCTIDSDWQGLLGAKGLFWFDIYGYQPRLRTEDELYSWMAGKINRSSAAQRSAWKLPPRGQFRASDIWKWKSAGGDKADNLGPGSHLGLIDLVNPVEGYRLADSPQAVDRAKEVLKGVGLFEPALDLEECEKVFRFMGVQVPILPYDLQAKDILTVADRFKV